MKKIVSGIALLAAAGAVQATQTYTDESAFQAAIAPGFYLEDFDGYVYGGFTEETLTLADGGWQYTLSAYGDGSAGLWSGDGNMSTNSALNPITVEFDTPVSAVGGWFFSSDIDGFYIPGTVELERSDGTFLSFDPPDDIVFRGFTTYPSTPFVSMTIDAIDDAFTNRWPTMDHFYVGDYIPAPSALALLGLGFVARRRR